MNQNVGGVGRVKFHNLINIELTRAETCFLGTRAVFSKEISSGEPLCMRKEDEKEVRNITKRIDYLPFPRRS